MSMIESIDIPVRLTLPSTSDELRLLSEYHRTMGQRYEELANHCDRMDDDPDYAARIEEAEDQVLGEELLGEMQTQENLAQKTPQSKTPQSKTPQSKIPQSKTPQSKTPSVGCADTSPGSPGEESVNAPYAVDNTGDPLVVPPPAEFQKLSGDGRIACQGCGQPAMETPDHESTGERPSRDD